MTKKKAAQTWEKMWKMMGVLELKPESGPIGKGDVRMPYEPGRGCAFHHSQPDRKCKQCRELR